MKNKTRASSGKHPDPIPAQATMYQRRKIMKDQIRKLKKSPDISKMYSISIPGLRITYYINTPKLYRKRLLEFIAKYPKHDMICKQPINKLI